nr:hypothetical protein [Sphingomonas laterariae]
MQHSSDYRLEARSAIQRERPLMSRRKSAHLTRRELRQIVAEIIG